MIDEQEPENRGTILVVDDTPASVGMIQVALEQENYQVLIAISGEKALERIEFIKPDLILLDIMMPGIDGYETCLQIKSNEKTKEVPIIFLSALSDTFDKVKAFSIGGVDYLTKPVEPEELLIRVKTHIRLNQLERELQNAKKELENRVELRSIELINANKILVEKEELLKGIFDLSPIGIGVFLPDGKIHDFNPALEDFFGVKHSTDLTAYNLFIDPNISQNIINRVKSGEPQEYEGLYDFNLVKSKNVYKTQKTGSRYYLMIIIPHYNIETNQILGYIAYAQDITEWKLKERGIKTKKNP
ncbi:MAG: response regulator [Methanomicrobiales archaeon]|nr:response regulator [Methanomicrobiales archaeon]